MKNHMILMKDNRTGQAYFYDFGDGCVYRDDQTKLQKTAGIGASLGALVGVLSVGMLGTLGSVHMAKLAPLLCAVSGLLLGMLTYMILNKKSFLRPENRYVMTKEQIRALYESGQAYRRSYFWMCIWFGLFSIGVAAFLLVVHQWALVICTILSWWVMGIMVWGIRPILQIKLRKWLYQ